MFLVIQILLQQEIVLVVIKLSEQEYISNFYSVTAFLITLYSKITMMFEVCL